MHMFSLKKCLNKKEAGGKLEAVIPFFSTYAIVSPHFMVNLLLVPVVIS